MGYRKQIAFAALLPLLCAASSQGKTEKIRPEKVNVTLVARSTASHISWGKSQDVYLAQMTDVATVGAVPSWIKLVDEYPGMVGPLVRGVSNEPKELSLRVVRDTQCDVPLGQIPLRTAPGDSMAIMEMRLGYTPTRSDMPTATDLIPCYRTYKR